MPDKNTHIAAEGFPDLDPTLFLDRADIARHLRLGLSTIDRLLASSKLPPADIRIGNRIRLWSRATIAAWRFVDERGDV